MSFLTWSAVACAVVLVGGVVAAAGAREPANPYTVHALVSDGPSVPAAATDPNLVNGWGLSAGPTTPWWASNNGTSTSTLYSGVGSKAALTVAVAGGPTGTVFNGNAADFVISQNGKSGAARFLFATEAGTITGWSPAVNGVTAVTGADRSSARAIYKELATANDRLYATDFHNARVDVFDKSFGLMSLPGAFQDPKVPKGFAPFGIQALAPTGFGNFAGDLLVGNFGNGRISAYARSGSTWVYKGQLRVGDGTPIEIPGLWPIAFGNGAASGPTTSLYFLSGPGDEKHGLFGSITAG